MIDLPALDEDGNPLPEESEPVPVLEREKTSAAQSSEELGKK